MFNRRLYFNSRGDGHPVLEVTEPEKDGPGESLEKLFVPLKLSHLSGTITGPLAQLKLKQVFQFKSQENKAIIEALYRFPLPGDSAVTGVRVRFGGVEIDTELKARSQAESDYEQARQGGRQAVLVNRETANVFTLAINGIKPGQAVEIETNFVELARTDGNGWALRFPLTTAPRYVRRDEVRHRQAQGQPFLSLRDPGHRFAMNIELPGKYSVKAGGFPLTVKYSDAITEIKLTDGEIIPDRDLFLQWNSLETVDKPNLQVFSWQDPADGMAYFLAGLQAPDTADNAGIPRETIILVDHSGSMSGAKWAAADWAVKSFLNQLQPDDIFNLGIFHNHTFWWSEQPRTATAANIKLASDYLDGQKSSGGTELGAALEQALAMRRAHGQLTRHVLLITDAEVSDMGRILSLVNQEAEEESNRRISVLCIDSSPNALLANEIADRSGGLACFLTSRPEEEDISSALEQIMEGFARPLYSNAILEVSSPGLEGSRQAVLDTMEENWKALDAGNIPAGMHRWINGRFPVDGRREIDFEFYAVGLKKSLKVTHPLDKNQPGNPALKALFGAGRLAVLEELQSCGLDGDEIESILKRFFYSASADPAGKKMRYAENRHRNLQSRVTAMLTAEALRYGLLSSETSFAAIRSEAGQRTEYTVLVPNAQPEGWVFSRAAGGAALPPQSARTAMRATVCPSPANVSFTGELGLPLLPSTPSAAPAAHRPRNVSAEMNLGLVSQSRINKAIKGETQSSHQLTRQITVFKGLIKTDSGISLLFDSSSPDKPAEWSTLPKILVFTRLIIEFSEPAPDPDRLTRHVMLILYCGDQAMPASRIRLAELLRQGGQRPLNISWAKEQLLKLVMEDPDGLLDGAEIAVRLEW